VACRSRETRARPGGLSYWNLRNVSSAINGCACNLGLVAGWSALAVVGGVVGPVSGCGLLPGDGDFDVDAGGGSEVRILFVFDPQRQAVLLVAGDKSGQWRQWYTDNIPVAEQRYERWLAGDYDEEI
jgi:hypothetical protein